MRNYLTSILIFIGFIGGMVLGCGNDDSGGDMCQEGTEMCACAGGTMCFSGLACVNGTCYPDSTSDTGKGTDTGGGTTGSGESSEQMLCEKTDECNLLMPGTSVQDCTDLVGMCTDDLLSSQYSDWQKEVSDCLEFANCQNFLGCVNEMSACPSVEPSAQCEPGCVYCWYDTEVENMCDPLWNGDGSCDCGCQFTDIDC